MALLATLTDFVRLGLPPAALVPPPRPIETIDPTTDRLLARGHGLVTGDEVRFETAGELASPLSLTATYFVEVVDLNLFKVKDGAGVVVDLTSAGTPPIDYRVNPIPAFTAALEAASSTMQDKATAHGTILEPTEEVIECVCILAAGSLMHTNRLHLPPLAKDEWEQLQKRLAITWSKLNKWELGKPIAGLVDATPSVAEMGASAALVPVAQPGGWGWGCGL